MFTDVYKRQAVKEAGYDSLDAAAADKVAFVFMGHGTSHTAKVSYSQMPVSYTHLMWSAASAAVPKNT